MTTLPDWLVHDPIMLTFSPDPQSGLYALVIDKVDSFRVFIGAPDHARFNLVLLGGEWKNNVLLDIMVVGAK